MWPNAPAEVEQDYAEVEQDNPHGSQATRSGGSREAAFPLRCLRCGYPGPDMAVTCEVTAIKDLVVSEVDDLTNDKARATTHWCLSSLGDPCPGGRVPYSG